MPEGSINRWTCTTCGHHLVAIHRDAGTTPANLRCRALGCRGRAVSAFYDQGLGLTPESAEWEWYRPTGRQLRRMSSDMRNHVAMGGLDLRPLTPREA